MVRSRIKRGKTKSATCYFCESNSSPDYKDTLVLRRFITERGKILPAGKSGICSKHQRGLAKAIKNARQMALIYYTEAHSI